MQSDFRAREIEHLMKSRMMDFELLLRAGAGIVVGSKTVTLDEWRRFVGGLNLPMIFPELHGLSYVSMWEPGKPVISLNEPASQGRLSVHNEDADSSGARFSAMRSAMESGQMTMTSAFAQLSEEAGTAKAGFVIYFPVYRPNSPVSTVDERRKAISGFVFSHFNAEDFIGGILRDVDRGAYLEVFDGQLAHPERVLFNSFPDELQGLPFKSASLTRQTLISWPTQTWLVVSRLSDEKVATFPQSQTWLIAVAGLTIDGLLFYLFALMAARRRETEESAAVMQARLANSESVLISAVEAIGEAFVVYDEEDRLVFYNDKYRRIYEASSPVIELGKTFEEIIRYGAERGQYVAAIGRVDAWVAERLAIHQAGDSDLIQLLDNGRWLKIRERKTASGHIVGFRVDVTDLYAAKEAAETSNKARSNFLATISHEIRTPMNGMLGMAQVLLSLNISEEERIDAARTILRSGQTLLNLLNDILDLSKIEAGKFSLDLRSFSPAELMREIVFLNTEAAGMKQLRMHHQSHIDPADCYLADEARLRQMLENLISNAIKFTPAGEIRVEVELQSSAKDDFLLFSVTDTGPGIPEAKQSELFEPFIQADSSISRQFGGTGLGLSIVRHLAEMMGGEAGVESEVGHGSRFWFRIKATRANSQTTEVIDHGKSDLARSQENGIPQFVGHVLIAEDDPISRRVLMSAVTKMGLTVVAVDNGAKAVKLIVGGETFDLVLMDLSMPVLDGYAAAQEIHAWQLGRHKKPVPVIAISADAFEDSKQKCREHGMGGFVEKPLNFKKLAEQLALWLPQSGLLGATSKVHGGIDPQHVAELICLIVPLLRQQKFDAFEHFKKLKSYVAGSEFADEIEAVAVILNQLEFEAAANRLQELAHEHSWNLAA